MTSSFYSMSHPPPYLIAVGDHASERFRYLPCADLPKEVYRDARRCSHVTTYLAGRARTADGGPGSGSVYYIAYVVMAPLMSTTDWPHQALSLVPGTETRTRTRRGSELYGVASSRQISPRLEFPSTPKMQCSVHLFHLYRDRFRSTRSKHQLLLSKPFRESYHQLLHHQSSSLRYVTHMSPFHTRSLTKLSNPIVTSESFLWRKICGVFSRSARSPEETLFYYLRHWLLLSRRRLMQV